MNSPDKRFITKRRIAVTIILTLLLLLVLMLIILTCLYINHQTHTYTHPVHLDNSLFCKNDSFNEIATSVKSWLAFVDSLNIARVNQHTLSKGFQSSTGILPFSSISIPLIYTSIDLLDFRIRFNVMKSGMNSRRVGGLNLRYNQVDVEVGGGNITRPKSKRHYPMYFNMTKYLDGISVGFPENETPINNDALLAVQLPKNTCNLAQSGETFDLVVLVKSCAYCTEQRSYARKTYMKSHHWNNFRVKFFFTFGLPTPDPSIVYHFNGVKTVFSEGSESEESSGWSVLKDMKNESDYHGDMLIGGFYDDYFNLTKNIMLTFRWASTTFHNRTPLFLFLGDDYVLHPGNTIKLVRSLNQSEVKWFAGGHIHSTSVVVRPSAGSLDSRWSILREEYPWDYYPPYFFDHCYMLGADLVRDASIVMSFTQKLRISDAYLGIVLARLNTTLLHMNEFSLPTVTVDRMSGLVIRERSMSDLLFFP